MSGNPLDGKAPRISAVLNTLNAAAELRTALTSLAQWVDEIVLVDMHSDDNTVAIAREFGAQVYLYQRAGYVEPAREYAVSKASGDWIMVLDADEEVPESLSQRLRALSDAGVCDAVEIPMSNIIFGKIRLGGGFGPDQDRHIRFFRRGFVSFSHVIHSHPMPRDTCRVLRLPFEGTGSSIIHHSHASPLAFFEKTRRYTRIEATLMDDYSHRRRDDFILWWAASASRVAYERFVVMNGYRDGPAGLILAVLMGHYRWALRRELSRRHVEHRDTSSFDG